MTAGWIILLAANALPQAPLIEGNPGSSVKVIIYEDLQCSDCATFRRMMDEHLLPKYSSRVTFIHREFPLAKHAWARKAAIAARYFGQVRPELGLAFRRYIMSSMKQTTEANFGDRLAGFAQAHEADAAKAIAALGDPQLAALVEKDFQDGVARGVAKTPTVFVNGQPFIEHFSVEEISKAIDQALAQAN